LKRDTYLSFTPVRAFSTLIHSFMIWDACASVSASYRALGGGWVVEQPAAASSHEQSGETVVVNDRRGGSR